MKSKLLIALTASLLMAQTLLVLPAGATGYGPNDAQRAAYEAAVGTDIPENWQTHKEKTTFYLHNYDASGTVPDGAVDAGLADFEGGDGYMGLAGSAQGYLYGLDTKAYNEPNRAGNLVTIQGLTGAQFNFRGWNPADANDPLGDWDNVATYKVEAVIFAAGSQSSVETIALDLHVQDAITGTRVDHDTGTAGTQPLRRIILNADPDPLPSAPLVGDLVYRGSVEFDPVDGFQLQPGQVFSFDLTTWNFLSPVHIDMDWSGALSRIEFTTDTARTNLWMEDRFDVVTDTFPSGSQDQTEDTRVNFKLAYTNLFGNGDCTSAAPWPLADPTALDNTEANRGFNRCHADGLHQEPVRVRIRDLSTGDLVVTDKGRGLDPDDPGQDRYVQRCCRSTTDPSLPNQYRLIEYTNLLNDGQNGTALLEYEFPYNETFPGDGDYRVEFFHARHGWITDKVFHIGGALFAVEPAPVEYAAEFITYKTDEEGEPILPLELQEVNHTINPGERTDYHLVLRNLGNTVDTFGLSVPVPGAGWQATVHPSQVAVPPRQSAEVTVVVVPPAGAKAGDWRAINVVAASILSDDKDQLRLNTTITGALYDHEVQGPSAKLYTGVDLIEVHPMVPEVVPAGIINMRYNTEQFVLSDEGMPPGWRVQLTPPSTSVYPQSTADFSITITAPPEAKGGDQALLILRATRVTDSADLDELIIPVRVIVRDAFSVVPYQGLERILRDVGNGIRHCNTIGVLQSCSNGATDQQFDNTVLYRFRVNNDGDRIDEFNLSAAWMPPALSGNPGVDTPGCDAQTVVSNTNVRDGVPDGWRFRILSTPGVTSPVATSLPANPQNGLNGGFTNYPDNGAIKTSGTGAFSGDIPVGLIRLGPHASTEFWIEMGWIDHPQSAANTCVLEEANTLTGRTYEPSPEAALRLTVRSENDPTLTQRYTLMTDTEGRDVQVAPGGWNHPNGNSSVDILPQLDQPTRQIFDKEDGGLYQIRAANTGNEYDNLTIEIGQEAPGWKHEIVDWTFLPTTDSVIGTTRTPSCVYVLTGVPADPVNEKAIVCRNIGMYHEVAFNVTADPPAGAKIKDEDFVKVSVVSQASANPGGTPINTTRSIFMRAIVGGPYAYDTTELQQIKQVHVGEVHGFPFSLENFGLMDDSYKFIITEGPSAWNPKLSSEPVVRVPSLTNHHGFLSVTVPDTASVGSSVEFKVQVQSLEGPVTMPEPIQNYTFRAVVLPPYESLDTLVGGVTIDHTAVTALQGQVTPFSLTVYSAPDEDLGDLRFEIDPGTLPDGWELVCPTASEPAGCQAPFNNPSWDLRSAAVSPLGGEEATARFFLKVPATELSTSRTAIGVTVFNEAAASDPEEPVAHHDVEINLATVYGVSVDTAPVRADQGGNVKIAPPGEPPQEPHMVRVTNTGLSPATVLLSTSDFPTEWQVTTEPSVYLGPGESQEVEVNMVSPIAGRTGSEATIRFFATVQEDPTKVASVTLVTRIGEYGLEVDGTDATQFLAPHESGNFQVQVANIGSLKDDVELTVTVPSAYKGRTLVQWDGGTCDSFKTKDPDSSTSDGCVVLGVEPETGRLVNFQVIIGGEQLPAGTVVPLTVTAKSLDAPVPGPLCGLPGADPTECPDTSFTLVTDTLRMEFVPYVGLDVDDDGLLEFAIDRDGDRLNGYEEFRESLDPGSLGAGVETRRPDMAQFLTDEAYQSKIEIVQVDGQPEERFNYFIDGDDDGRWDFFLDLDKDQLPDVYMDPDARYSTPLNLSRDVSDPLDGVAEYFIDMNGDGLFDRYFDITLGVFGTMFQIDVDDDGYIDYVIDQNRNGETDDNEPILFGGPAGIVRSLLKIDIDGNGKLDEVYDEDGDGDPDYFIPAGSTKRVKISVRDVNRDGRDDWAFDGDGDGREDSYYDTKDGKAYLIDEQSAFMRSLQQFWYVGVVFALVLVLFVVLVAVTRR